MSAKKTFVSGQGVEVWRRVFSRWERAVYEAASGTPGTHVVQIGGGTLEFTTRNIRALERCK